MTKDTDDMVVEKDETPDTVRVFSAVDLLQFGLPRECKGGKVLEDRLLDKTDELRRVRGKTSGNVRLTMKTDEHRFVIFELADGAMWGVPYTKHESGRVSFDVTFKQKRGEGNVDGATDKVMATKYEYQQVLVQAVA